jgi:hypothetical protein
VGFLRRLFASTPAAPAVAPWRPTRPITEWPTGTLEIDATAHTFERRGNATIQVAGESHYQDALERAGGGRGTNGVRKPKQTVVLLPEPTNEYDLNAVRVLVVPYGLVGYLSRGDAVAYRPVIDRIAAVGWLTSCHGTLTGGWDRGRNDRGSIGIELYLRAPAKLLAEIDADPDFREVEG